MYLVVGLGNPGQEYAGNRHNLGFRIADELAARARAAGWRAKYGAALCEIAIGGERALLCKPMEFMNVSGQAVARVAGFWKIPPARTVVAYDELDLPLGRLKLGTGGGHGGHNGVRSMIADLGTADFARVRVGIGRPPGGRDPADFLLSDFTRAEEKDVGELVGRAADAVEAIVKSGLTAAMNAFNIKSSNNSKRGGEA
jgi:peptidyl-tRNA hydrolase, PTH1 family